MAGRLKSSWMKICFFFAIALSWSAALAQTITVGQGPRQWQDGGGGIDPQFPVSTTELATGNTPGGVIDFDSESGWIFLQQIDPSRNLALGAEDRGGGMNSPLPSISDLALESMIDGKPETAFRRKATTAGELVIARGIIMDLDLGARFGVNRIRFFPRNTVREAQDFKFENDFMRGYSLALNDGSEETSVEGRPQYLNLIRVEDNIEAVVDLEIPLQYVRFIRLKSESNIGFEVDEIETYGSGFVPEAQYLSDIFDLEDLAIWGNLRWAERREGVPGLSAIRVFTRSGRDETPYVFNRLNANQLGVPWKADAEVDEILLDALPVDEAFDLFNSQPQATRQNLILSQADYEALADQQKATLRDDVVNWSTWSPPYPAEGRSVAGTPIISPGPRRYFQFRIDFASRDLSSGSGVDSLSFDFASPVPAERIVGEIFPRDVPAGEVLEFTYGIWAGLRPQDTSFNRFEIATPSVLEEIGRIELRDAQDNLIQGGDLEVLLSEIQPPFTKGDFSIESTADGRVVVGFPELTNGDLLKITFKTSVLRFGQTFAGRAWLSDPASQEGTQLPQQVVPGNAAQLAPDDVDPRPVGSEDLTLVDNSLSVRTAIEGSLLGQIRAVPPTFTPNGDGVNDTTVIHYDVLRLGVAAPLRVEIYDLSGRSIAAFADDRASGRFSSSWDGLDSNGNAVPPGIYLFRVFLDTNAGSDAKTGAVGVVY